MKSGKWDKFCINTAKNAADMSYCVRAKVGAVIAKNRKIISVGYNGTLPGEENVCEIDNVTKDTVIHAEANAILKMVRSTESIEGATLYCTLSPCMECAKLIVLSGIVRVVFLDEFRVTKSLYFLREHGIIVEKYLDID